MRAACDSKDFELRLAEMRKVGEARPRASVGGEKRSFGAAAEERGRTVRRELQKRMIGTLE